MEKKLPEGWGWILLKEIAGEFISGGTPSTKRSDFWDGDIPWITSAAISEFYLGSGERYISIEGLNNSASHIIPKGNVIVATRVGIGKSTINLIDVAINQDLTGIIVNKEKIVPEYLAKFLLSPKLVRSITSISRGTTIRGLKRSDLEEIKIPLPPLETQRRIVAILEKAEETRRLRAQADELAGRLIQSTFIEIIGDPWKNPNGWEIKKLDDICEKITDGTHKTPVYLGKGVPFLSVKNLTNSREIDFENTKHISEEEYSNINKRCNPERNDILYTKVGTYGIAKRIKSESRFSIFVSLALLKPKKNIVDSAYLEAVMNMDFVFAQAKERVSGIGVPDLHLVEIKQFKIPIPPLAHQKKFADFAKRIEATQENMDHSMQEISRLSKTLMQRAFTGELA